MRSKTLIQIRKKAFKGLLSDHELLRKVSLRSLKYSKQSTDHLLYGLIFNLDRIKAPQQISSLDALLLSQYIPELFKRLVMKMAGSQGYDSAAKQLYELSKSLRNIEYTFRITLRDLDRLKEESTSPLSKKSSDKRMADARSCLLENSPLIHRVQERATYIECIASLNAMDTDSSMLPSADRISEHLVRKFGSRAFIDTTDCSKLDDRNLVATIVYALGQTSLFEGVKPSRPGYVVNVLFYLLPELLARLESFNEEDWEDDVASMNKEWFNCLSLYQALGSSFRAVLMHIEKWYDMNALSIRPVILNKYIN